MSKRKEITSYFQPKKKQTTTCEDEEPSAASIAEIAEIEHLKKIEEIQTGKGLNQIGTLQHPGDTRWSSHFTAICSLIRMYGATRSVLIDVAAQGTTFSQRDDALIAIKMLMSYEFVFILHVVKEIMVITDLLCRALQQKSQDILNAMHLVSITKMLIQKLRSDGWESLLENVRLFCERHTILITDMNAPYFDMLKSLRRQGKQKQMVIMEHHYRVEIFTAAIDQ
ncbi:uncharacterized protein LOC141665016 [Apium graveolens]|uniref:uncharacterized protein LOC141665016 n=1 Tax=Apium graveolens TaxID=4045 RepID=UPI003D7B00E1